MTEMHGPREEPSSPTMLHLRWRGVAAALPALALLGGGLAYAGSGGASGGGGPAGALAASSSSPSTSFSLPTVPALPISAPGSASGADGNAPGLSLPPAPTPRSSSMTLDTQGIPAVALAAYHKAAGVVDNADPACNLDWALVAAIGRVESDHGRYGGSSLGANGVATPGIYGIPLDGRGGTASIHDTDNGVLDHDTTWDRAVGPMQFIPGTWKEVGSDLDGDGVKNPQDINDAAAATAIYLCAGPGSLSSPTDAYDAVRRYNNSDSYARTVLAIAAAYRSGKTVLPLADLPAASGGGGSTSKHHAKKHHGHKGSSSASGGSGASGAGSGKGAGGSSGSASGSGSGSGAGSASGSGSDGAGSAVKGAGSAVTSAVGTLASAAPTALPTSVSGVVCPIATAGSGLGLPVLPLPGCPTPTAKHG